MSGNLIDLIIPRETASEIVLRKVEEISVEEGYWVKIYELVKRIRKSW